MLQRFALHPENGEMFLKYYFRFKNGLFKVFVESQYCELCLWGFF